MTHSLPRHGRFLYLTETMTKSHCSTQQTLLKSDVKNKDISNILVKMKEKTCTFQNILIKSLISREKYCCSMNSSCSEVFKTVQVEKVRLENCLSSSILAKGIVILWFNMKLNYLKQEM